MPDPNFRVKAALGALVTAYQSAGDALKDDDMERVCRWISVAMKGERTLLQELKGYVEQTGNPDARKFLAGLE
jgi:hypothetical protein